MKAFAADKRGTVTILSAALIAGLIGIVSLVAEYGLNLERQNQDQRIADAAAYAAATYYGANSGASNVLTIATSIADDHARRGHQFADHGNERGPGAMRQGAMQRGGMKRGPRAFLALLLRDGRGASGVEFVLVAIPLMAFMFGILEFGRAIWIEEALQSSAATVARCIGLKLIGCASSGSYSASLTSAYAITVAQQWDVTLTTRRTRPRAPE